MANNDYYNQYINPLIALRVNPQFITQNIDMLAQSLESITQSEVGEKCNITQRKLSFIENGTTEPNLQDLRALCLYYGVSADYILGLPKGLKYPER